MRRSYVYVWKMNVQHTVNAKEATLNQTGFLVFRSQAHQRTGQKLRLPGSWK